MPEITSIINAVADTANIPQHKGLIDCSANPNFPAASRGHKYKVSVAGKIGGAAGTRVFVNDIIECHTDSTAAGNLATVGANWSVVRNFATSVASEADTKAWTDTDAENQLVNVKGLGALLKQGTIASATNITVGNGGIFIITGTTDIDTITVTDEEPGRVFALVFEDELTLNGTGAASYETEANDIAWFRVITAGGVTLIGYQRFSELNNGETKVYRALLTQTGTDDPTVVAVLENTLSAAIVWTYGGTPGRYIGTLTGAFPANKVFAPGGVVCDGSDMLGNFAVYRMDNNTVRIIATDEFGTPADDILLVAFVEILVYP